MALDYCIGQFMVRPAERRVFAHGRAVALGSRAFDLLLALIERRERIVGKDELLALVWPAVVVEEGNLAVHVNALRKLLGAEAISTVPGRGYRFTAPVTELASPAAASQVGQDVVPPAQAYGELMRKLRPAEVGAPAADGSLAGVDPRGHLPAAMTALVGRLTALEQTQELLQATRCLTLTGAGGSGKTRLALGLAEAVRSGYPGGAWWVALERVSEPQALATAVVSSVGASNARMSDIEALVAHFKGRKALLVLDNCEHLIDACAELAAGLLRELPMLRVLATSRESLRIAGEVAWSVPPLEIPADLKEPRLDELLRVDSVRLLVQRIQQHDPRFTPTPAHAASLARICRGLEGLPLALELAAAQVGPQTLAEISARLAHILPLLIVGERGGVPHHRTMAAAVDWGWRLLGEAEATLFLRLSVFTAGWTLQAAEALCPCLGLSAQDLPAALARLHRVSMVLAQGSGEGDEATRYRMLEPIRQFAFGKLEEAGEVAPVRRRLLAWYTVRCKAVSAELAGAQQAQGYAVLVSEVDNLGALLAWSLEARHGAELGDLENGLRLACDLWRFWQVKGHAREMLDWFDKALPLAAGANAQLRADANNTAGVMARTCGAYAAARQLHGTALEQQRKLGNRRGEAVALNNLCVLARDQYDHEAVVLHAQASLEIAREIGERNLEGLGLMHLGAALRGQGRSADAQARFRQSLAIFSELGDRRTMAALLNYLGNLALTAGRWAEAAQHFEASLGINETLGDFWGLGISSFNQAALQCATEDTPAAALPKLMQSFAHYRRAGVKHGVEECFELLAHVTQALGQLDRAAWCWGVVERLEKDLGKVLAPALKLRRAQALQELRSRMPAEQLEAARVLGQNESLEQALGGVLADRLLA